MTIHDCLQEASKNGVELREARLLLAAALETAYESVFAYPERVLTAAEEKRFFSFLSRRLVDEPISKILGQREFWGLPFLVTHDTLDPRPDSETLIEAVLKQFPDHEKPYRILDLGTGTGCLLLSVLSEYPKASGIGVDISEAALAIARKNMHNLGFENRCVFIKGNWGEDLQGSFDIILCNPPYIAWDEKKDLSSTVLLYDPPHALFAEEHGLQNYRLIAQQLPHLLKPEGGAFFEIGQGQQTAVIEIFHQASCPVIKVYPDLAGIPRCVVVSCE